MDGGKEVWTSGDFKNQIDDHGARRQRHVDWTMRPNCRLEGFEGRYIPWSVTTGAIERAKSADRDR